MKRFFLGILSIIILGGFLMGCSNSKFNSEEYNYNEMYKHLDNDSYVFQKVNYDTLMKIVGSKGTYVLYLGGAWCPNCQAAIPFINDSAILAGVDTIYNFDTRLIYDDRKTDIRNCSTKDYRDQWANFVKAIGYKNPSGVLVTEKDEAGNVSNILDEAGNTIERMSVPTLLVIKDGKMVEAATREYFWDDELEKSEQLFANELNTLYGDLLKTVTNKHN